MLWPNGTEVRPPISSSFGPRQSPIAGASTYHRGTDFVGFALIRSISDGVVEQVGTPPGWAGGGRQVWVRNSDGSLARYLHMKNAPAVRVGERVTAGRILGLMGMTGTATGVHLHLEVVVNGAQIDPVPYITTRIAHAAPAGNPSTNKPADVPEEEDDDMPKNTTQWYKKPNEDTYVYLGYNTGSGFFHAFGNGPGRGTMPGTYTKNFKDTLDSAGWAEITESHARVIEKACAAVRGATVSGSIEVTIVSDAEVAALDA